MDKDELLKLINLRKAKTVEKTTTGFRELVKSGYIEVPASKGIEPARGMKLTEEGATYLVDHLGVELPTDARHQELLKCIYSRDVEDITMIEFMWLNESGVIDLEELNSTNVRYKENTATSKELFTSMDN